MVLQNDFTYKICIGGMGAVGKTSFIFRYLTDQFIITTMTVGVQLHSHALDRGGKRIGLIIWDLGGQERFRFLQASYMRGASAAMIMFDLTRLDTLFQTKEWIQMIRDATSPSIPIFLIGTKMDVTDEEMFQNVNAEAIAFAKKMELTNYLATSSKDGTNVHEAVGSLLDLLLNQKQSQSDASLEVTGTSS
jgi:Ras-related protein Rab-5C